jgi:hypothetical protein
MSRLRETRLFRSSCRQSLVACEKVFSHDERHHASMRGAAPHALNATRVPVGVSPVGVSRFVAGTLAALWAMAGLASDYAALAALGPTAAIIIAIVVNASLVFAASLAFVRARSWRHFLLAALLCVTADRIAGGTAVAPSVTQTIAALVAALAIGAATLAGFRTGD